MRANMKLLVGHTIAQAIRDVLRDPDDDRIVVVVFVGRNPLAWIPQAQGLRLYCWTLAGATHPDGIRALLAAGADVHLVRTCMPRCTGHAAMVPC